MRLLPREAKFFELFAELSNYLTEAAKLLKSILEDPRDLILRVEQVQAIEHKGDRATHAIITKLNQSFITPFDREDIHKLASSLDDVLDFTNAAATPACAVQDLRAAARSRRIGGFDRPAK